MKPSTRRNLPDVLRLLLAAALMAVSQAVWAAGNIDTNNSFAWSENAGWINFAPTNGGVTVTTAGLSGYAWAENIGWIRLGCGTPPYGNTGASDWGVNAAPGSGLSLALSGYAWSENCGWINFHPANSQVTISTATGVFDGYAWAENIGWIRFRNASPVYNVRTTATLIPPGTALLFR